MVLYWQIRPFSILPLQHTYTTHHTPHTPHKHTTHTPHTPHTHHTHTHTTPHTHTHHTHTELSLLAFLRARSVELLPFWLEIDWNVYWFVLPLEFLTVRNNVGSHLGKAVVFRNMIWPILTSNFLHRPINNKVFFFFQNLYLTSLQTFFITYDSSTCLFSNKIFPQRKLQIFGCGWQKVNKSLVIDSSFFQLRFLVTYKSMNYRSVLYN